MGPLWRLLEACLLFNEKAQNEKRDFSSRMPLFITPCMEIPNSKNPFSI